MREGYSGKRVFFNIEGEQGRYHGSGEEGADLLHAKVGAIIAKKEFGIIDADILSSIRTHTTGEPDMSLLQKIIFTADYIEPGRDKAKRLDEIRELAFSDLDICVREILFDTLSYLDETKSDIDPATRETYEFYSDKLRREF